MPNIYDNLYDINVEHIGSVLNKYSKKLKATTFRNWTPQGDKVGPFNLNEVLFFNWYLVKTGYQGNNFLDDDSANNYHNLKHFVETSNYFEKIDDLVTINKSVLSLYKRK
jgi:hypothetical protein